MFQSTKKKKDEQAAQNLIFCMDGFNIVPFDESASSFPRVSLVLLHHLKYWKIFRIKKENSLIISWKN